MRTIKIKNFESLENISLTLDKHFITIIGEQASGKSTLAKVIYFFLKLHDYLLNYLLFNENFRKTNPNESFTSFLKYIRRRFTGYFGTTKHMDEFQIEFCYGEEKTVVLSLRKGYVQFRFADSLKQKIRIYLGEAADVHNKRTNVSGFWDEVNFKNEMKSYFKARIDELFQVEEEIIYVPAGRSLLSTLSSQLDLVDTSDDSQMDVPLKDFIRLIHATRTRFGTDIKGIVSDYTKTISGNIKNNDVDVAYRLIKKILKGEYRNDREGEKLYYRDNEWVKLMYASSGQQDALWIVLPIFLRILERRKVFLILEEPEAHLYPATQKDMIELVALLIYSTKSSVFVTTHSPYILTSINLLSYSGRVENQLQNSGEPVIEKSVRLNPNVIQAYHIASRNGFRFESIFDEKEKMIRAGIMDSISSSINRDMERIMDLEVQHDLF